MIRLILGQAGTGKTARIFREIADGAAAGRGGLILLVPEQYSHEAERELCQAAGDTLSRYGEVLSFTGLARKVFSQCGGQRPVMDGGGRLLCMAAALRAVADRLRVYHRARRDPRLLEGLLRAVEELKTAGITADVLNAAAGRAPGALGDKLHDLALLTEGYAAVLGRSAADPADQLQLLAERIGDSPSARCRYYIDGFSDFTALEKNVLRELIRAGAELTVCLTCSEDGAQGVFRLPMATVRWLEAAAAECGQTCVREWMESPGQGSPIEYFCAHLFDFAPPAPPENHGAVTLVSADDVGQECELAAARMAELARAGCRWRDMAVAVRGFSDYRTALESACARYGVPLFMSGRGDTLQKNVPLLILSALEAVNRGYEYEAVFGYLKTGLAPLGQEERDRLENYVLLWGIRGNQWDRPWAMHPEGYNRPADEASQQALEQLNAWREQVIGPLKVLERRVKAAKTAAEQAMALSAFLEDVRLVERLQQRAEELESQGRQEAAAEYARLWDVTCAALEQFAAVLGDMEMDGELFESMFSLMLSKYDVGIIPVSLDRVSAGDMDGMRRRHIKHLLVLGAADGRVPAPEQGGGVFTPEEREELLGLDIDLGGVEEELSRELGLIYSCLSLPSETLYMSWPATDSDGGEARPSLLAERASVLLGIEPERGDLERARSFAAGPALFLALQAHAGRSGSDLSRAAAAYFARCGREEELSRMEQAAGMGRPDLSPSSVRTLYGDRPGLSPTRAEKFSDCRFGYFLRYGLRAKPREAAVFDPRDYGTFMHYILENVAREVLDLGGFPSVTEEDVRRLADKYVDTYIKEEMRDFGDRTTRFEYLFRRLRTTVRQVTADMWRELKDSKFQPIDLELDLRAEGVLEPGQEEVPLSGRADRVDGWVRDGVLYLRVTDYKTGVKKFSLSDVCQGVNLQMLLYLFALQRRGKTHFGVREIRPAGVLYCPARFDIVSADSEVSDEELAALRRTSARRSGLVLDDPEVIEAMEPGAEKRFLPIRFTKTGAYTKDSEGCVASLERFGALSRYIDQTLTELGAELRAGSVAADPWYKSQSDNACTFCEFREACLFDETGDGWRMRESLRAEQAWERIEGGHE